MIFINLKFSGETLRALQNLVKILAFRVHVYTLYLLFLRFTFQNFFVKKGNAKKREILKKWNVTFRLLKKKRKKHKN